MKILAKTMQGLLAAATLAVASYALSGASVAGAKGEALDAAAKWLLILQPAATWWFLGVLAATVLAGRLFCRCLCPLGVAQSAVNWIFHPKTKVRRVCTRLPGTTAQTVVRLAVLAAFCILLATGFGAAAWAVGPYSIFGKAITMFVPSLGLFAAILVAAAVGKGRLWCNWICPAGTFFNVISRVSLAKDKVEKSCANCRACFPAAKTPAGTPADDGKPGQSGATRRETLRGFAVLAAVEAAEKTTDGGFADVSLPGVPERDTAVLPPNALDRREFNVKCVACGRCIKNCRGKCLAPSVSFRRFGQPEMDFRRGYCLTGCKGACAQSCPTGAIREFAKGERTSIKNGVAKFAKERCIRETEGVECTACSRKCPVSAISVKNGFPVVDETKCIGCGACEHVCPARPLPAIAVAGFDHQTTGASPRETR